MLERPGARRRRTVPPAAVLLALGVGGVLGTWVLGPGGDDTAVHHEVTGVDGDRLVSVTHGDGGPRKVREEDEALPWREHVEPTYEVDVPRVSALGTGSPVTCRTTIHGEVVAEETSDGSAPVLCEGTSPYLPASDDRRRPGFLPGRRSRRDRPQGPGVRSAPSGAAAVPLSSQTQ